MMTPLLRSFAFGCSIRKFHTEERNSFSLLNQFKLANLANVLSDQAGPGAKESLRDLCASAWKLPFAEIAKTPDLGL